MSAYFCIQGLFYPTSPKFEPFTSGNVPVVYIFSPCNLRSMADNGLMARVTVTFTISLPPPMATQLEVVMKKEHRTRSELVREALRQYFQKETK